MVFAWNCGLGKMPDEAGWGAQQSICGVASLSRLRPRNAAAGKLEAKMAVEAARHMVISHGFRKALYPPFIQEVPEARGRPWFHMQHAARPAGGTSKLGFETGRGSSEET